MARFFFHLATGQDYERDDLGSEHCDANQAYLEAFETAQQIVVDLIREHRHPGSHRFDICDEQGRMVFQLPFSEIVGHRIGAQEAVESVQRGNRLATQVRDQIITARNELETLRAVLSKL